MDQYQEVIEEARARVKSVCQAQTGEDGWALVDTIKDVTVIKTPSFRGVDRDCSRSTTVFNVPLHFAVSFILDDSMRKEYDAMFDKIEDLEVFDAATKLMHRFNKSPNSWIITPRDFSLIRRIEEWDEGEVAVMIKSCENPKCPEQKGFIRGLMITNGFVLKDLNTDPPSCQFMMISQFDPKGKIPEAFLKRMSGRVFTVVETMRGKLEEFYKKEMQKKEKGEKSEFDENALAFLEDIKSSK